MKNWIVITGPTASGKTRLAVAVAKKIGGEIISIDSRQVYKELTIGTGKDLEEYTIDGTTIPYHLIDIAVPNKPYHIAQFQNDFTRVMAGVEFRQKTPILCGGSGLYLQSALEDLPFIHVPIDPNDRKNLVELDRNALKELYGRNPALDYAVDFTSKKRLIRAIEIQRYLKDHLTQITSKKTIPEIPIFLVVPSREERRHHISQRLQLRMQEGLMEEVAALRLKYSDETLKRLGLEYKYVTSYLNGEIPFNEMMRTLETAIHQFAKRQMTWFRRMERQGYNLVSIDASISVEAQVHIIIQTAQPDY